MSPTTTRPTKQIASMHHGCPNQSRLFFDDPPPPPSHYGAEAKGYSRRSMVKTVASLERLIELGWLSGGWRRRVHGTLLTRRLLARNSSTMLGARASRPQTQADWMRLSPW